MRNEFLDILAKLINFHTTPGNTKEISQSLDYVNKQLGFYPFFKKTYIKNGVESRVWSTSDTKKTRFILNAHIDVVPADDSLFSLKQYGDKLMGRGVSDMKYSIALYIIALKNIYNKYGKLPSVALMITSDEENGGFNGVKHLLEYKKYISKVAFVPDGGENNTIVEKAKGVVQIKITSLGKGAHGARLWEGRDAILPLAKVLINIREQFPFPNGKVWHSTINFGKINGGIQTNQVADKAEVFLDIRFIPEDKPSIIINKISKIAKGSKTEKLIEGSSFRIDKDNKYISLWSKILGSNKYINEDIASDGRYFVEAGIPVIVSKPHGGFIHNSKEWTSLISCLKFGQAIEKFLLTTP